MVDEQTARKRIKETLQNTTEETACATCLAQLADYVTAQINGRPPSTLYPHIASHLDGCLTCAAAYARLYRLEMAAAAETLPELQQPRQPDLSFLPSPAAGPSWQQRLKAAFTQLQNGLRLQLSADLLPHLPPPARPALTRTVAEERYAEQLYALDSSDVLDSHVPLKLSIYRDGDAPQNCLVEVSVAPAGRAWPLLAGIVVTLALPTGRREERTNAWGVAAFPHVPLAELSHLLLEVQL
ncbi:MAG: hypothetical protein H6658_12140 [Ardenticatenaceae bacterium]|nr:hypothetical protein [Ardenticatenaceae bacterium]